MRHAHAGDRETWSGDDRLRPLSAKGSRQAIWLVDQLRSRGLTRLLTSPYLRCVQTLEPLASATGLRIERDRSLAEGEDPRACLALLDKDGVVVCTHGDIVEGVLADQRRRGHSVDISETPKGAVWTLGGDRVELLRPPR